MPRHEVPARPKLYHIVHADRLTSIIADGGLLCDTTMMKRPKVGTAIGMTEIKARRARTKLASHPELNVGDCVPFYFCPRSVMLYLVYRGNHQGLTYRGGQEPIVHLEADLHDAIEWASGRTDVGRSPRPTQAPPTSMIGPTWKTFTESTGRLSEPGIGGARKKGSRPSF